MLMQREAARRVQRMQEHSRRVFEAHQGRTPESLQAARTPGWPRELVSPGLYARSEPPAQPASPPPPPMPHDPPPTATLSLPRLEPEQWLLLGLALLLFRSGCRPELTLALLYLAL